MVSESGHSMCQSHAQRGGGVCANRSACLLALLYDTKILHYTISHPYSVVDRELHGDRCVGAAMHMDMQLLMVHTYLTCNRA